MASNTIKTRIQLKNDTETNWNKALNFIPKQGEVIIYSTDDSHPFSRIKIGDGSTKVINLPFIHSGIMKINNADPDVSGNFTLSAGTLGLNTPLNIIGFLSENNDVDLNSNSSITDIPRVNGVNSYIPKEGDVILDSRNGIEFVCVKIEEITGIDEQTGEETKTTYYSWKQLGKNAAAVFQQNIGKENNNNYPITLSPETSSNNTTNKIFKNIYLTFNPNTNNLIIGDLQGGNSNPGSINGYTIHNALSKDFADYNHEIFPNGLNYRGIATNKSSGTYNTYTLEDETTNDAKHGDLIYYTSETEAETGYYIFNLKTPPESSTWDKIVAKSIGQSDKLITERLLYYYEGNNNISKLGTITNGTWNAATIDVAHGGTGQTSFDQDTILYSSSSNTITSGQLSWSNWVNHTSDGPTIQLNIGSLNANLPAIPSASKDQSGIITTSNQTIEGIKTLFSGQLNFKVKNSNVNKIIFGTQSTPSENFSYYTSDQDEWASINVKMPSETTEADRNYFRPQFSFKQYDFSATHDDLDIPSYARGNYYEEYLLPEVSLNLDNNKTYTILTSKGTSSGALYAASNGAEPQWGTLPVAQGGTGQTSFEGNAILYGNGSGAIQAETPQWQNWIGGTTSGPQAVLHIGNSNYTSSPIPSASTAASGIVTTDVQSFAGNKTFTGTIYINNNTDITGTNDTGSLVIGAKDGENLALDANEIMARNNQQTSNLNLNIDNSTNSSHLATVTIGNASDTSAYLNVRYTTAASSKTTGALRVGGGAGFGGAVYANAFNGPLTGNVTGNISGYSGTGTRTRTSLVKGTNPSSTTWQSLWYNWQSTGSEISDRVAGAIESYVNTSGVSAICLRAYQYASGSTTTNSMEIKIAKDGTCSYAVSDAAAFRTAIGAMAGDTTVTQVRQGASTSSKWRKILLGATEYAAYNTDVGDTISGNALMAKSVAVQPSTGKIQAAGFVGPLTGDVTGNCSGTSSNVTGTVAIAHGGTGATTAAKARQNLFGSSMSSTAEFFITINTSWETGGYVSLAQARNLIGLGNTTGTLGVAYGGTGAKTFTSGDALIGAGTSAITTRNIVNNTTAGSNPTADNSLITANTLINYKGTSNINTVGTITSGTWNAGSITSNGNIVLRSTATASDVVYRVITGGATNNSTWTSNDITYTVYAGDWGNIRIRNRYKAVNSGTTTWTPARVEFRVYSATASSGTRLGYYDGYALPGAADGKTASNTYSILTTKSAVTVAQGGTGATTATAYPGLRNLGLKIKTFNTLSTNSNGNMNLSLAGDRYQVLCVYASDYIMTPYLNENDNWMAHTTNAAGAVQKSINIVAANGAAEVICLYLDYGSTPKAT